MRKPSIFQLLTLIPLLSACTIEERETTNQDHLLGEIYPKYVIERADTTLMDSTGNWSYRLQDIGSTQEKFDSLLQEIAGNSQQALVFASKVVAKLEAEKNKKQESDSLKKKSSVSDVDTVSVPRNKDD